MLQKNSPKLSVLIIVFVSLLLLKFTNTADAQEKSHRSALQINSGIGFNYLNVKGYKKETQPLFGLINDYAWQLAPDNNGVRAVFGFSLGKYYNLPIYFHTSEVERYDPVYRYRLLVQPKIALEADLIQIRDNDNLEKSFGASDLSLFAGVGLAFTQANGLINERNLLDNLLHPDDVSVYKKRYLTKRVYGGMLISSKNDRVQYRIVPLTLDFYVDKDIRDGDLYLSFYSTIGIEFTL